MYIVKSMHAHTINPTTNSKSLMSIYGKIYKIINFLFASLLFLLYIFSFSLYIYIYIHMIYNLDFVLLLNI
jgi:hypothetical protein